MRCGLCVVMAWAGRLNTALLLAAPMVTTGPGPNSTLVCCGPPVPSWTPPEAANEPFAVRGALRGPMVNRSDNNAAWS